MALILMLPEMFPALASEMDAEWRGVTLEQLLAHRGGMVGAHHIHG